MPPILIAFFVALGISIGPPVVRGVVTPKDSSSRPKMGKPDPVEYRAWASRTGIAISGADAKCRVTYFAMTTGRTPVRLIAGGKEQLLDVSWTFDRTLAEGERRTVAFEFRDPVGGEVLACREKTITCYASVRVGAEPTEVQEGGCHEAPELDRKAATGKPRLVLKAPFMVLTDPAIQGAFVTVHASIEGQLTEDWYCPRVVFTWPDGTRSEIESDCPAWPPEAGFRQTWSRSKFFGEGEWDVVVSLERAGKVIAREPVRIRVKGGADAPEF